MTARAWRHHNAALLRPRDLAFLAGLPEVLRFTADGIAYGMTHAYRDYDRIANHADLLRFQAERFGGGITRVILGHTHVAEVRGFADGSMWMNPGSASYGRGASRDGFAHYLTISDGEVTLRHAAYDRGAMLRCLEEVRMMAQELEIFRHAFG